MNQIDAGLAATLTAAKFRKMSAGKAPCLYWLHLHYQMTLLGCGVRILSFSCVGDLRMWASDCDRGTAAFVRMMRCVRRVAVVLSVPLLLSLGNVANAEMVTASGNYTFSFDSTTGAFTLTLNGSSNFSGSLSGSATQASNGGWNFGFESGAITFQGKPFGATGNLILTPLGAGSPVGGGPGGGGPGGGGPGGGGPGGGGPGGGSPSPVPEPSSLMLCGVGVALSGWRLRRRS